MKIGEVAQRLDVPIHVLRHWDDMGVVVAGRSTSGHRIYTEEHLYRLRILQACQGIGMSLAEIRKVLHRGAPGRATAITHQLRRVRQQRIALERTEQFLTHVIDCRHDLLTRCPACSAYAEDAAST
ncbi:MerR family transcriptional regulator [Flexivirga meconopsidis]|uniref:MerR family transcriptional regulator n=1 Tax=Flexivirga meconopsidis TaxID=2977121 RepID=UPI0022404EA7|nr:MerR family transcriptional regulator [Flexivirga meconopsidis]